MPNAFNTPAGSVEAGDPAADHDPFGDPTTSAGPPIQVHDVHKRFGGVHALRGVNFTVTRPGVVHALLGTNGSGKSTLLGVLAGQVRPDAGELLVGGKHATFRSAADAITSGVVMVSQEVNVAPDLSITENILMGRRLVRSPIGINWRDSHRRAAEVLASLHLDYSPTRAVRTLRANQRQMVEIARAVSMDAKVLILDEPTSSLAEEEVRSLFEVIDRLKSRGVAIIFVSHRLPEVTALADELTVLRNGAAVASGPMSDYDTGQLIEALTGEVGAIERRDDTRTSTPDVTHRRPALVVNDLRIDGLVPGINLDVRPGEIVGLAGLEGCGRSEIVQAIFGARRPDDGRVIVDGTELPVHSPRSAMVHGLGYLPSDRRTSGLVLSMSIEANLTMVASRDEGRLRRPTAWSPRGVGPKDMAARMRIRAPSFNASVGTLSGGNQQKVALGKWLISQPKVLLLEDPTRGVDIGAKAEIHLLLKEEAARGLGILVTSAETDELLLLCDRILVIFRGEVVANIPARDASEADIARLSSGH